MQDYTEEVEIQGLFKEEADLDFLKLFIDQTFQQSIILYGLPKKHSQAYLKKRIDRLKDEESIMYKEISQCLKDKVKVRNFVQISLVPAVQHYILNYDEDLIEKYLEDTIQAATQQNQLHNLVRTFMLSQQVAFILIPQCFPQHLQSKKEEALKESSQKWERIIQKTFNKLSTWQKIKFNSGIPISCLSLFFVAILKWREKDIVSSILTALFIWNKTFRETPPSIKCATQTTHLTPEDTVNYLNIFEIIWTILSLVALWESITYTLGSLPLIRKVSFFFPKSSTLEDPILIATNKYLDNYRKEHHASPHYLFNVLPAKIFLPNSSRSDQLTLDESEIKKIPKQKRKALFNTALKESITPAAEEKYHRSLTTNEVKVTQHGDGKYIQLEDPNHHPTRSTYRSPLNPLSKHEKLFSAGFKLVKKDPVIHPSNSKLPGLKTLGPSENPTSNKQHKIKFFEKEFASLRVGVPNRLPTPAEIKALPLPCDEILEMDPKDLTHK